MKLTKRIIFIILALTITVTALTVIAFAAEEQSSIDSHEKKLSASWEKDTVTESYQFIGSGGNLRFGYIYAMIADNKNKYVEFTPRDYVSTNSACYIDLTLDTTTASKADSQNTGKDKTIYKYNPSDYPYMVYDFDVMTPTGTFGGALQSFTFRLYTCQYKSSTSTARTMVDTAKSPLQVSFSAFSGFLDTTPYNWQHVTFVMKYAPTLDENGKTADVNFIIDVYINGKHVTTTANSAATAQQSAAIGFLPEDIGFYSTRMSGVKAYLGTKVSTDDPGYVADDPTTHFIDHIAFDNNTISYYTGNYGTSAEIAAERFPANYELPYKYTVATITNQDGTVTYYDEFDEAFAEANSTNTLTVFENIDGTYMIDKAMTVNKNGFVFNTESRTGYIPAINGDVYTFTKTETPVKVVWDPACTGECSCYYKKIGHTLTEESVYAPGYIPKFYGREPQNRIFDGLEYEFVGWTYEKGGTTSEDITAIPTEAAGDGVLYIYPVYELTQYSFEVTNSSNETNYYLESEYPAAIAAVAAGGTIKLHTDVTVENGHTFKTANANIVFDLNGHDFNRFNIYSVHYEAIYDEATDTYSKGAAIPSTDSRGATSGATPAAFTMNATGINFTIKNSGEAANIYTFTLCRDAWLDANGNVCGYDRVRETTKPNGNQNSGAILFSYAAAKSTTINIEGDGISYYGACLIVNEWGGNQNTTTFNINGGSYYAMVDTYLALISLLAGGTVDVQNATIVANGAPFIRVSNAIGNASQFPVTTVDFTFTNCDIIDSLENNNNTLFGAEGIKLYNCNYYAHSQSNQLYTIGRGTRVNLIGNNTLVDRNCVSVANSYQKTFNLINETSFITGDNSLVPNHEFTPKEITYSFVYKIADIDKDCTLINWIDPEGYLVDSTYALKNSTVEIPYLKVPTGDGWRGVTNVTTWLDENGNASNLYVGENAEYEFFAVLPAEENREYCACMTSAMFNMVYFTNFAYNVYVPKEDSVEITELGGSVPKNTVWIHNVEYWVYTTYAPSTQGLDEKVISLTYVIDGESYSAIFKPSAIFYANVIVNDYYAEQDEKELVGCLIRYIEESYLAANDGVISEENQAKLDSFYSIYTPMPYATEYPDAALFDSAPFVGLLSTVSLSIESGKVRFVFTLTDDAVAANYKVKAKGLTGALYSTDGKVFISDNTPLRTHVMETFTISIVDESGNTVTVDGSNGEKVEVSSYYSLAAYVNATDNALAKSLYAFGTALRAYYPVDENNYQLNEITLFGEDIKNYTIAADIDSATEYYVAEELQALIYTKSGYWLEIVPSSDADKSIVINLTKKTGGEGFTVIFTEGRIELTCEYEALIHDNAMRFFKQKFATLGSLNFTEADNYTENIRDIFYSDFGAVGDGITDDSEAIRAAHEYANGIGHTVCADPNATYYIGPMSSHITIQTDVNWGNAKFIIDDTVITPEDPARAVKIFNVSAKTGSTTFSASSDIVIAINNAGGIDADTVTRLDLGLGYPALVQVINAEHKNYIRYGANANSGASQQEMILIDADGNIDPSTPFMFDYEKVTSIIARKIDAEPITIEGGIFTTKANAAPCAYTQYARNIQVTRPNTTVKNITHYITDEGETGAPYDGFLKVHLAYNVTFEDCLLSGHKIYYNSEGTGMGTYDISATSSINISWKNCTQTNFFSNEATEATTKSTHWGIMGSSYCKNLSFDSCQLTRFDAHAGIYNVNITDTEIIHITIVGGGTVNVENTTIYHNAGIQLRTDYGNFWHGDVILKNISFRNTGSVNLITCTWYNHDFGYPTALPENITVDGLTLKKNATVNIFSPAFVTLTNDIIKDSFEIPVLDEQGNATGETVIKENINKMSPPKTITLKNNTNGYTVVFPDKAENPFFADCEYNVINAE